MQKYRRDSMEIIVADAGSKDDTAVVARGFGARVVRNELRLAEPGVALGIASATFPYCVVMAADNALPHAEWLANMVRPLDENPAVGLCFTHIINDQLDNQFNQYFNALHADPFNAFVFGYAARPAEYSSHYQPLYRSHSYTLYRFDVSRYPLIALAQGTTIRKSLLLDRRWKYDDILPIIELISRDVPFAYVPSAGIYHYSMPNLNGFIHKYDRRIVSAVKHGYVHRSRYHSNLRRARQYVWPAYSFAVFPPALAALCSAIRTRRTFYAYHPVACLLLSLLLFKHLVLRHVVPRWLAV